MPLLPFGEYRPDVSDYDGQTTKNILNVLVQGDGYAPFNDFAAYTPTLPAACRGFFYARKNDGSVSIFAGTSTKLYQVSATTGAWVDVSKGASTYTAVASGAQWQFCQANQYVFATQVNAPLQIFDLTGSTAFADAAGSPPQAAYITLVNRFLVLTGLASPNVYRIQWSGLNDFNSSASWTSGTNQSDYQDLADGGIVRGVAGGESGFIFQDQCIRQMAFAPGSPYVFSITRVAQDDGLLAPYSLVPAGDKIFFFSPQGFKSLVRGGLPTPIGKERIDRTFLADVDTANLQLFLGANDPRSTRVFWAYKSLGGATGLFDKILIYDWALDKWTRVSMTGEYIASLSTPGLSLEQLDAAYGPTDSATVTMTSANPGVVTWTSHGKNTGDNVWFTTTGALPTNVVSGTEYYIVAPTTNTFEIAATAGGTPIDTTAGVQSGVHTGKHTSVDSVSLTSFDNVPGATTARISMASSTGALGFFTGNALEATLETPEQGADGRRVYVNGFEPVTDAASVYGSLTYRETTEATAQTTDETVVNAIGVCPQRRSGRYFRGHVRIPAGTTWTYAAGVNPQVRLNGKR